MKLELTEKIQQFENFFDENEEEIERKEAIIEQLTAQSNGLKTKIVELE